MFIRDSNYPDQYFMDELKKCKKTAAPKEAAVELMKRTVYSFMI